METLKFYKGFAVCIKKEGNTITSETYAKDELEFEIEYMRLENGKIRPALYISYNNLNSVDKWLYMVSEKDYSRIDSARKCAFAQINKFADIFAAIEERL